MPDSKDNQLLADADGGAASLHQDPRFHQPTPSSWKRAALLLFIAFLFWLAFSMRGHSNQLNKVIYAQRYSKEHKFRPAASPIITERLKDGRVKLRGAHPTPK